MSKRQDDYHVESRTGIPSSDCCEMGAYVRHPLIERHDLGLLIMRNMRMAVDSQVRHDPGSVLREELALHVHPVEPKLAVSLPVAFHATAQPEVLWSVDPDPVHESVRGGAAGADLPSRITRGDHSVVFQPLSEVPNSSFAQSRTW